MSTNNFFSTRRANLIILMVAALFVLASSPSIYAYDVLELNIKTAKKKGKVRIKLLDSFAPKHVERIKQLTNEGAYDNVAFHRAIPGFMVQTGDVQYGKVDNYNSPKAGTGSSTYPDLYLEPSRQSFEAGIVGMARGRYMHSANSQFFIMVGHHPNLNSQYTIFGVVIEGLDLVKKIKLGSSSRNSGKVEDPDYIVKARIVEGR